MNTNAHNSKYGNREHRIPFAILCVSLSLVLWLLVSCSEDRATDSYATHPVDWSYPESDGFHGLQALNTSSRSCATCHGNDFMGGSSGVGCYDCHNNYPHPAFSDGEPVAHATSIAAAGWSLGNCQSCHGIDFSGGRSRSSCLECHVQPSGPAACTTCHGTPPTQDAGVLRGMPPGSYGAHELHVVAKGYACTECHAAVNNLSHIGPLPADVSFAQSEIASRPPYPTSYEHLGSEFSGNGTCATYCHSDARGGDPIVAVQWVGMQLNVCQSCHSVPPASPGHPVERRCHLCHFNVDPASNYDVPEEIIFSEPDRHVNGVVDIQFFP